jgi:nucleoside-diphosphate-sugar epimerase
MGLLHGEGVPRIYGDGSQTRDYVFVEDAVGAMLAALDSEGGVFNVGTGVETSVLELYDAVQRASGVTREPAFAETRLGELQRSVLDSSLAERELGWRPGSSLDEGLARTWAWIVQE